MTGPKFPVLMKKFEKVSHWKSVCPFLLDDDNGTITEDIYKNHPTIFDQRAEMLRRFLQMSNPTWKKVLDALKLGYYSDVADEIEHEVTTGKINQLTS